MTFVEGESFDILVGSGSGEGLEAWRRLHNLWDPLTTGRARGLLREILSLGRAKLVELQGAVERLEDLMRRYTQRRPLRGSKRIPCTQAGSSFLEKTETILWMLADSDNGTDDPLPKERGKQ